MTFKKLLTAIAVTASLCLPVTALATTSNYTTYASGQTLTAASLNSLQTNYTDGDNNILNGDIFTGNMLWHSGVDALFYTDAGTTLSASILGDSGNILGAARTLGWVNNCGITYAASTLTITDSTGSALSASNPCSVTVPSSTAGALTTLQFTAAVSSTFGDASDTDENLFGVTTGVAWGSAMPMFLHVCDGSGADYFGFSRNPARIETGNAATDMAQEGDTDGDAQGDLFIMSSGLTLANEVNRPCVTVGSFQATMTSGNDWAVSTLVAGRDGFGLFQEGENFAMSVAQNGATAAKYFVDGAGTAPVFTTNSPLYQIDRSGRVTYIIYFDADGGTDGATAGNLTLTAPLASISNIQSAAAYCSGATTITGGTSSLARIAASSANITFLYNTVATSMDFITNAMLSNGGRTIQATLTYLAF